jgi:membrane protease YdiL (CAAX protease family)
VNPEKYTSAYNFMAPEVYYIYYALLYLSMVLVPFLIVALPFRMKAKEIFPVSRRVPGKTLLLAALAGLSCCMVANAVTTGWCGVLESVFGVVSAPGELPMDSALHARVMYFCIYAVLPALAEEIAFRGVVFGLLRPCGKMIAVVGSAFVFGIMHGNLLQIPFAFIGGLFFGYLLAETGSILPCVLLHFCNNGLSVIQMFLMNDLPESMAEHIAYGMMILTVALGIVCLILLLKRNPRLFRMEEEPGALSNKEKFRAMALNPAMVVAYVIIGLEMLFSMQFRF